MDIDIENIPIYCALILVGLTLVLVGIKWYKNELDLTLFEQLALMLGIVYILLFIHSLVREVKYTIKFLPENQNNQESR